MKKPLLLIFFTIINLSAYSQAFGLREGLLPKITLYDLSYKIFDKSDIWAQSINTVIVMKNRPFPIDGFIMRDTVVTDTAYMANFDSIGRISKETWFEYGHEWRNYEYYKKSTIISEGNDWTGTVKTTYLNKFDRIDSVNYRNNKMQRIGGEKYIYNNNDSLILIIENEHVSQRFFYDNYGRLIKHVRIYYDINILDSIMEYFTYDKDNNLVAFLETPSETFCKNFPLGCDAADVRVHLLFVGDSTTDRSLSSDLKPSYTVVRNFDFGTVWTYYGGWGEPKTSHYFILNNFNIKTEINDDLLKITTYQENCGTPEGGCLPDKMEFRFNNGVFFYYTFLYK